MLWGEVSAVSEHPGSPTSEEKPSAEAAGDGVTTEGAGSDSSAEGSAEGSHEASDGHGPKPPSARRRRKGAAAGAHGGAEAAPVESPVQKLRGWVRAFAQKQGLYSIKQLYQIDAETRGMVRLLGLSGVGLICLLLYGMVQCGRARLHSTDIHAPSHADSEKEALLREREKADQEASWLTLERIHFELRLNPASKKTDPMRMAWFDLAIHADSPETKAYLEEAAVPVRSAMNRVLMGWDRETLLTADGKKKLIAGLMDAFNNLLPEGKITEMYFTKFVFK